jgi:uncharacterized membrane protein YsdA (DUF1294 family)
MEETMVVLTLLPFGLAVVATLALALGVHLNLVLSWLASINVVTFFTYGYDKSIAGSKRTRVPETALLLLALAGGTIGALLGMGAFHHKTSKTSFRLKFGIVLVVQIALLVAFFVWVRPALQG